MRAQGSVLRGASTVVAIGVGLIACKGGDERASGSPSALPSSPAITASAAPSGGLVAGIPIAPERIAKVVNPKGEPPYSGPTGALKGVVRVKGDPALPMDFSYPTGCGEAAATYGKLFRSGQDGTLADVMVAVTGYQGFVPAREPAAKMTIHGCALAKRTMAVTFGQRVEVSNIDKLESYMPYLDGAPAGAVLVAVPGGDPVRFYPREPGHYLIRDQLPKPFLTADVYVVAYATHDVTGLDGMYEIKDIPVGKVAVNAFLPAIDEVAAESIEIKPGDNTLDFTISFDRSKYDKKRLPAPKPPASGSASKVEPKG